MWNMHRAKLVSMLTGFGFAGAFAATFAVWAGTSTDPGPGIVVAAQAEASAIQYCSSESISASSFYAEISMASARMHAGMRIVPSGNTDHDFARMMISHHQGAIEMALAQLKYGRDKRLRRLAQSIIVEQGQEIAYMRTLLDASLIEVSATNQ
jgi:phage terminase large subunit-like protein